MTISLPNMLETSELITGLPSTFSSAVIYSALRLRASVIDKMFMKFEFFMLQRSYTQLVFFSINAAFSLHN